MHFLLELRCEFYKTVFFMHRLKQQLNRQPQYGTFWGSVNGETAFLIHQYTNSPGRGLNFGLCYLQNTNKHFPISNGTGHSVMAQHSTDIQTALHTRNEQEKNPYR
jgi:glucose/arabinose dehydrogenase